MGCFGGLAESTKCCYHSGPDYGIKSATEAGKNCFKPRLFALSLILLPQFLHPFTVGVNRLISLALHQHEQESLRTEPDGLHNTAL